MTAAVPEDGEDNRPGASLVVKEGAVKLAWPSDWEPMMLNVALLTPSVAPLTLDNVILAVKSLIVLI